MWRLTLKKMQRGTGEKVHGCEPITPVHCGRYGSRYYIVSYRSLSITSLKQESAGVRGTTLDRQPPDGHRKSTESPLKVHPMFTGPPPQVWTPTRLPWRIGPRRCKIVAVPRGYPADADDNGVIRFLSQKRKNHRITTHSEKVLLERTPLR